MRQNWTECGVCVWQYELLFCVDDSSDAAIMVVNSLIQKYPQVNARLFAGGLCPSRVSRCFSVFCSVLAICSVLATASVSACVCHGDPSKPGPGAGFDGPGFDGVRVRVGEGINGPGFDGPDFDGPGF